MSKALTDTNYQFINMTFSYTLPHVVIQGYDKGSNTSHGIVPVCQTLVILHCSGAPQ